ncbi:glycosyltransferase family 8 protein [Rhizobiaceae bacterium LC148]|jgi:lipopolysaccharide biosynthesis glycosyltransferase|nr:hypothetical protein YH62_05280 [Rhizobium sp. LC145]TKT57375.1 glycosyltransferase family 8 protein [Rhizobiaceae bacterium LC148]
MDRSEFPCSPSRIRTVSEARSNGVIRIMTATDRNYVEMTGVLIASISRQPHGQPVEMIVLSNGLTGYDKRRLHACQRGRSILRIVELDEEKAELLSDLRTARHLTASAYARIMIPDLLPSIEGRVLYLDCDIVVNAPLDELFTLDLKGRPAALVRNAASPERLAQLNTALGHPIDEPYFNSGVLLIDLGEWRRQELTSKCMAFALDWEDPAKDHDQAVLNHVLRGNWLELDVKWNQNPRKVSVEEAAYLPVQHFWGKAKPTHCEYPKEYREVYDHYRAGTPWASARLPGKLERRIRTRLLKAGAAIDQAVGKLSSFIRTWP